MNTNLNNNFLDNLDESCKVSISSSKGRMEENKNQTILKDDNVNLEN